MKFRIKQIDEETFIPQCKPWWDFDWGNIDLDGDYVWYTTSSYSRCQSLELAKVTIEKYKSFLKLKKQYPKYYKI
jgi:hypothetical protein